MRKIVIVTNSLSGGGAERAMNLLANGFNERGHKVTLIAINDSDPDAVDLKCRVVFVGRKWRDSILQTFSSWIVFQKTILSLKPDFVILNCDLPEFFGAISFLHARIIAVEHVNHPWRTRVRFGKIIRSILQLKNTTWVAVSNHLSIWPNHATPAKVIYNPVQQNVNLETRSAVPIKRLVFIGRLTFQKNPEVFVQIAHQTDLPVLILGDGENSESIKKTCIDLDLKFLAPGWSVHPWQQITEGDLLLVPSRYEGDGLVVIEAMLGGIPLIVSDIPEFRRFQLPDHNYATDLTDFVVAINQNLENALNFQVPEKTLKEVLRDREISNIITDWEEILEYVMGRS